MRKSPEYDPDYIRRHPYATLVADEYRMGRAYRIVRPDGTGDHLLMLTKSGGGRWNGTLPLPADTLLLVRPGTPHDYGTDPSVGNWNFLWLHFHAPADWLPFLALDERLRGVALIDLARIDPVERRRIRALVTDAVLRTRRGTALDRAFAMNALENVLLRLAAATRRADAGDTDFVDTVAAHVRDHLKDALNVRTLARVAGLSPSRFAHKFTDAFGESPAAFVERCRLDYAKRLLETESTCVKEAAYEAGFADPLHFSKRFRRAYGMTPSSVLASASVQASLESTACRPRPALPSGPCPSSAPLSNTSCRCGDS